MTVILALLFACSGDDPNDTDTDAPVDTDTDTPVDTDTVVDTDTGTTGLPIQADLVIRNATVFPATGEAAFVGTVVVNSDRIDAVVAGDSPDWVGTEEIDGTGRTVVPGFVHLLTHMSVRSHVDGNPMRHIDPVQQLAASMEERLTTTDPAVRLDLYRDVLRASLRGGVTTFVDSISSLDDIDRVRALTEPDLPDFYSLGPILSPPGHHPPALDGTDLKHPLPIQQPFASWEADLVTELESWFTDHGVVGLKVAVDSTETGADGQVPPEAIQAICDIAHAHGGPCFFLSYTDQGMVDAAVAGGDVRLGPPSVITPFGFTDPDEATWTALVDNDVAVLTLGSTFTNLGRYVEDPTELDSDPHSTWPGLPTETTDNYDSLITAFSPYLGQAPNWMDPLSAYFHGSDLFATAATMTLADAHSRGMTVIPATSAGSPWVFHGTFGHELELLSATLSVDDVLTAATIEPARILGMDGEIGTLEVGKRADLVLLGGDPWSDPAALADVQAVVRAGIVVPDP